MFLNRPTDPFKYLEDLDLKIDPSTAARHVCDQINEQQSPYRLDIETLHGYQVVVHLEKNEGILIASNLSITFASDMMGAFKCIVNVNCSDDDNKTTCSPKDVERALLFIKHCERSNQGFFKQEAEVSRAITNEILKDYFEDGETDSAKITNDSCIVCHDYGVYSYVKCCNKPLCIVCADTCRTLALRDTDKCVGIGSCPNCRDANSKWRPFKSSF